jgi:exonuclease SbcC
LDTEAALSKVQAVHLAGKLVDGEPCSVCGSPNHPSPATGSAESQGLNKAFEDARAAKQLADQKERQAQSRYVQAEALFEAAQAGLSARTKPEKTAQEADAALATAQSELTILRALPSVESAMKAAVDAGQKWTDARQALEHARTAKDYTGSTAIACAQKLESAFDGIDESLRSQEAVATARKTAETHSNSARQRHEATITAEREAQRALDVAEATLRAHISTHETATKTEGDAKIEFCAAIDELGWSEEDYAQAKADIAQHGALTQEVQTFRANVKSSQDRLDRANATVAGLVPPDLPALTLAAQEAATVAHAAQERHSQIIANLTQQEATEKRCNEIKQSMEDGEKRYAVVGELKAMTNGDNQFRMSLVDYAIAATFEDVLEAANTRFSRMSRGRFALLRRTEMKDGRSRAGLDIVVHDNFTDRSRDAHTLSGGESFMAALSLALGLSDVVQQRAGGIKLDVIFIDEGFGSLDDQTLDNALSTLRDLVGNNRAVGVISHVEMVKQQIQAGFEISRGSRGSRVNQRITQ